MHDTDQVVSESQSKLGPDRDTHLNLGSVHALDDVLDDEIEHPSSARSNHPHFVLPETDGTMTLPRLAAMIAVNRSQGNNYYARAQEMQNRRLEAKYSGAKKRPASATRPTVSRKLPTDRNVAGAYLPSPNAVPATLLSRDKKYHTVQDPLTKPMNSKRSPFNSPRVDDEQDRLQELLTLSLREYYEKHPSPVSFWGDAHVKDLPLIKRLFPINGPNQISVSVNTAAMQTAPVNSFQDTEAANSSIAGHSFDDGRPLDEVVREMLYEDSQLKQINEHIDFPLDAPKPRVRTAPRPLSAHLATVRRRPVETVIPRLEITNKSHQSNPSADYDHQTISTKPQNNTISLTLHSEHEDLPQQTAPTNRKRPSSSKGLAGSAMRKNPFPTSLAQHPHRNARPKSAVPRTEQRKLDDLTKMFQFADLEVHPGANVLFDGHAYHGQLRKEQQQPRQPSPPSSSSYPRPQSSQRNIHSAGAHRRLVNPTQFVSELPHETRSLPFETVPDQRATVAESRKKSPQRTVMELAYNLVQTHEKNLLKSGYDVPISILAATVADHPSLNDNLDTKSELLPTSLQTEIQRQVANFQDISRPQIATSYSPENKTRADAQPVLLLHSLPDDILSSNPAAYHSVTASSQQPKRLQLKWKRFLGGEHDRINHKRLDGLPSILQEHSSFSGVYLGNGSNELKDGQQVLDGIWEDSSSVIITDKDKTSTLHKAQLLNDVANSKLVNPRPPSASSRHTVATSKEINSIQAESKPAVQPSDVAATDDRSNSIQPTERVAATDPSHDQIVQLNPLVHSPRLDQPFHASQQEQLVAFQQWRHPNPASNGRVHSNHTMLPGRKLSSNVNYAPPSSTHVISRSAGNDAVGISGGVRVNRSGNVSPGVQQSTSPPLRYQPELQLHHPQAVKPATAVISVSNDTKPHHQRQQSADTKKGALVIEANSWPQELLEHPGREGVALLYQHLHPSHPRPASAPQHAPQQAPPPSSHVQLLPRSESPPTMTNVHSHTILIPSAHASQELGSPDSATGDHRNVSEYVHRYHSEAYPQGYGGADGEPLEFDMDFLQLDSARAPLNDALSRPDVRLKQQAREYSTYVSHRNLPHSKAGAAALNGISDSQHSQADAGTLNALLGHTTQNNVNIPLLKLPSSSTQNHMSIDSPPQGGTMSLATRSSSPTSALKPPAIVTPAPPSPLLMTRLWNQQQQHQQQSKVPKSPPSQSPPQTQQAPQTPIVAPTTTSPPTSHAKTNSRSTEPFIAVVGQQSPLLVVGKQSHV